MSGTFVGIRGSSGWALKDKEMNISVRGLMKIVGIHCHLCTQ